MVWGSIAQPTTAHLTRSSCHKQQPYCSARPTLGAWQSRRTRHSTQLRVAQQLGDAATEVNEEQSEALQEVAQQGLLTAVEEIPVEVPADVLTEFEHELEEDLASVAVTLTAVTGVIIFWRGVWSLLDYLLGDSIFGDICCIFVGLTIVLGIRLSGIKVSSSFWPPS